MKQVIAFLLSLFSLHSIAQKGEPAIDTAKFDVQSGVVNGHRYTGYFLDEAFYLLNDKKQVIIKQHDFYNRWSFVDVDHDGYKDVLLNISSNVDGIGDLFLFIPATGRFRRVKGFSDFPAAIQIPGTKYYYSYHKAGCADMNWASDLFYIDSFNTIKIGAIEGVGCDGDEEGIYISTVKNAKKHRIGKLPITTLNKYKNYKWGFIDAYWKKNYTRFISSQ